MRLIWVGIDGRLSVGLWPVFSSIHQSGCIYTPNVVLILLLVVNGGLVAYRLHSIDRRQQMTIL